MAENNQENAPKTLLIAHATAQLVTGESFELLPFTDENDVKAKFSQLMDDWAKSGFLLRGPRTYPWHQVRQVNVTSVDEVPEREARQRMLDWELADMAHQQQSFWKTKKQQEADSKESKDGKEDKSSSEAR